MSQWPRIRRYCRDREGGIGMEEGVTAEARGSGHLTAVRAPRAVHAGETLRVAGEMAVDDARGLTSCTVFTQLRRDLGHVAPDRYAVGAAAGAVTDVAMLAQSIGLLAPLARHIPGVGVVEWSSGRIPRFASCWRRLSAVCFGLGNGPVRWHVVDSTEALRAASRHEPGVNAGPMRPAAEKGS